MKKKAFSVLATVAFAAFIATGSAQAATEPYTVKSGDTLWKIATLHKLTVDELKTFNNLESDTIKLDQQLVVSAKSAPAKQPVAKKNTTAVQSTNKAKTVTPVTSSTNSWTKQNTAAVSVKAPVKSPATPVKPGENAIVNVSLPLLDTPYVWAGVTEEGFDCSGFIYYVFNKAGIAIPRLDTLGMFNRSVAVSEPIPGDLLFFENTYREGISHAGIYLGDGKFIHAGTKKVEISDVELPYWKEKFVGYKRFDQIN